jgi:hypothetical protein
MAREIPTASAVKEKTLEGNPTEATSSSSPALRNSFPGIKTLKRTCSGRSERHQGTARGYVPGKPDGKMTSVVFFFGVNRISSEKK